MIRRRLDPALIALAGAVGLPHRAALVPVRRPAAPPAAVVPDAGVGATAVSRADGRPAASIPPVVPVSPSPAGPRGDAARAFERAPPALVLVPAPGRPETAPVGGGKKRGRPKPPEPGPAAPSVARAEVARAGADGGFLPPPPTAPASPDPDAPGSPRPAASRPSSPLDGGDAAASGPPVSGPPGLVPAMPPTTRAGVRPTDEQAAIVAAARGLGAGDALRVVAFAGSGKTTTLKMVAEVSGLGRGLYVAFNSAIAARARSSFPAGVECRTMSSVAWRALGLVQADLDRAALGAQAVRGALGGPWLPRDACGLSEFAQARLVGRTVVAFCQSADREVGADHVERVLDEHVYRIPPRVPEEPAAAAAHRLAMERRDAVGRLLARHAPVLWGRLGTWREGRGVKIGHDVYLKAFELDAGLVRRSLRDYDYLALDEAQDLNPVMRSIAGAAGLPLIAVGDPWQQVYTFRGAEDALDLLPGRRLHLSQSFRFGEAIAAAARRILDSKPTRRPLLPLRGSDRASRVIRGERASGTGVSPRVTLCRSNAGVLSGAIAAARAGRRPHVVGGIREMAEELREAQALYEGRLRDIPETSALRRFAGWRDLCEEVEQTGDAASERLVQAVEEGVARDLVVLERMHAAAEESADEVFSTAHRAKGREWPEVFLHEDFPDIDRLNRRFGAARRFGRAADLRAALEEWHVLYVAVTRAIDTLVLPRRLHEWLGDAS